MSNTSLPPIEADPGATEAISAPSTRDRLLATVIAVLDYYHESRQTISTGLRLMLEIVTQAVALDDDLAEQLALIHLRTMLEIEELLTIPSIAAALEHGRIPPPVAQPWQSESQPQPQEIAPCPLA